MSLTDAEVRNAKPNDKVQYLFDGAGLYLQINPNGSRWWRFKYRFEGKANRAQYLAERKTMMQWWGDYLEGVAAGAKVIPLYGKAA